MVQVRNSVLSCAVVDGALGRTSEKQVLRSASSQGQASATVSQAPLPTTGAAQLQAPKWLALRVHRPRAEWHSHPPGESTYPWLLIQTVRR